MVVFILQSWLAIADHMDWTLDLSYFSGWVEIAWIFSPQCLFQLNYSWWMKSSFTTLFIQQILAEHIPFKTKCLTPFVSMVGKRVRWHQLPTFRGCKRSHTSWVENPHLWVLRTDMETLEVSLGPQTACISSFVHSGALIFASSRLTSLCKIHPQAPSSSSTQRFHFLCPLSQVLTLY